MVFIGLATSDAYDFRFKVVMLILAAVGAILTPIYLLSMLREMLYGPENRELVTKQNLIDSEPREVFIVACMLVPIIGIGLYPKVLTQVYDATTDSLTALMRSSVPALVQQEAATPKPSNSMAALTAPEIGSRN